MPPQEAFRLQDDAKPKRSLPLRSYERLDAIIDWEIFRPELENLWRPEEPKSNAGRPAFDVILMFKALVLRELCGISDEQLEFELNDSASKRRFIGLTNHSTLGPDAKTIWKYREGVDSEGMLNLFKRFEECLAANGYMATKGQIIDSALVETEVRRKSTDSDEENSEAEVESDTVIAYDGDEVVSLGAEPKKSRPLEVTKLADFEAQDKTESQSAEADAVVQEDSAPKSSEEEKADKKRKNSERQIDTDATWTQKRKQNYFGYKNHINVDEEHKLIRRYLVTPANVHDVKVAELLLSSRPSTVYADKAYVSSALDEKIEALELQNRILHKAKKDQPLTEAEELENKAWSKIRVRVEHAFGAMSNELGADGTFRRIGLKRATVMLGMRNLVYNMHRFTTLETMPSPQTA